MLILFCRRFVQLIFKLNRSQFCASKFILLSLRLLICQWCCALTDWFIMNHRRRLAWLPCHNAFVVCLALDTLKGWLVDLCREFGLGFRLDLAATHVLQHRARRWWRRIFAWGILAATAQVHLALSYSDRSFVRGWHHSWLLQLTMLLHTDFLQLHLVFGLESATTHSHVRVSMLDHQRILVHKWRRGEIFLIINPRIIYLLLLYILFRSIEVFIASKQRLTWHITAWRFQQRLKIELSSFSLRCALNSEWSSSNRSLILCYLFLGRNWGANHLIW